MASVLQELSKLCTDVDAIIGRFFTEKGDPVNDLFALCLEVKREKPKEEQCSLLHKIENTGIVRVLIDAMSHCGSESSEICSIMILFMRCFSEDPKYSQKMIDRTLNFKSSLPTPTCGILCLLDAVSWCPINFRHQIINKQTLDYVLSSIHLDFLVNDDASLKLRRAQCRLLFILMHLEYSVRVISGHFIADRIDNMTHVLHSFLNTEDEDILKTTLRCFKKFEQLEKLIPLHCVSKITDLLTSNRREFVQLGISALVDLLSGGNRFTTFEHLEGTVDLFLQCDVFEKLHIALSELILIIDQPEARDIILQCCMFLDLCFEYVGPHNIHYMIQSVIENNIMQHIMNIMRTLPGRWRFKFIWMMLRDANEEQMYFMIVYQDIFAYMCNFNTYFLLMENTKRLNKEKHWMTQDSPMHVRISFLIVFEKVLKLGTANKEWNGGKNVCLEWMVKYGAIRLLTSLRDGIVDDDTENELKENKDSILKWCNRILQQLIAANDNDALIATRSALDNGIKTELIVSRLVREYNNDSISKQKVPSVVATMIGQFCLVKCDFHVPYLCRGLRFQLDVNGMVITKENKQCGFCQNADQNMQRCSGCQNVYYCNRLCQRKDWKRQHKKECAKMKHLTRHNKYDLYSH
eukprot:525428_1